MKHAKCGGRLYIDTLYRSKTFIDIACLMCGKRWHPSTKSKFVQWLFEQEKRG